MAKATPLKTSFTDWTLLEWLNHLESRYAIEIKLGLSRIKHVAAIMDLNHPSVPVITVAGTNGKGTTVAALEAIYIAAGYRVGAYTSPHLSSFNERIRVNAELISDQALCQAFCAIEIARANTHITYFEAATLAALLYFKESQVDLIILEVGMGGRLDATNILDPSLSIITTIDFDHQEYLGNTLDQIGFEKAGILRSATPYIYADLHPPRSILEAGLILKSPAYLNGQAYQVELDEQGYLVSVVYESEQFQDLNSIRTIPSVPYHPYSIAAAIMATGCLQSRLPLTDSMLIKGISAMKVCGRQQLMKVNNKTVLFDVSHNAQSVRCLSELIGKKISSFENVHAVFSALADKNIDSLIAPMAPLVTAWNPAILPGKRASTAEQLSAFLTKYDIIFSDVFESPALAFEAACNRAGESDLIIVYGSFLTVGAVYINDTRTR